MSASLESILCTRCGLCCNGSFLADVEISRGEALRLEAGGLEVEEEGAAALLVQPCGALKGTRCSIYAHRPKCCRTFECLLLKQVRRGELSIPLALRKIEKARAGGSRAELERIFLGA